MMGIILIRSCIIIVVLFSYEEWVLFSYEDLTTSKLQERVYSVSIIYGFVQPFIIYYKNSAHSTRVLLTTYLITPVNTAASVKDRICHCNLQLVSSYHVYRCPPPPIVYPTTISGFLSPLIQ